MRKLKKWVSENCKFKDLFITQLKMCIQHTKILQMMKSCNTSSEINKEIDKYNQLAWDVGKPGFFNIILHNAVLEDDRPLTNDEIEYLRNKIEEL